VRATVFGQLAFTTKGDPERVRAGLDALGQGRAPTTAAVPGWCLLATTSEGEIVAIFPIGSEFHAFRVPEPLATKVRQSKAPLVSGGDPGGGARDQALIQAIQQYAASQGAAGASGEPAPSSKDGDSGSNGLNFPLSPVSQHLLGTALATLMATGSVNNAALNAIGNPLGLGSMLLSQALGQVVSKLMSGWTLDDESSAAEFAAKAVVDKLVAEVQSQIVSSLTNSMVGGSSGPGVFEQINDFFGPVKSEANLEAAVFGTPDDKGNFVVASAVPSVLVQGVQAAAAMADMVIPAGKPISEGSTTVRLGESQFMFARESSKTMAPSVLGKTGVTVLVGGAPPDPLATRAAEEALAAGKGAAAATEKSDGVTTAANRAREKAKASGKSDAEADAAAARAAAQKAAEKPVVRREAEGLNNAAYRDGEGGLLGGVPRDRLQEDDVVWIDPETGKHYTERELAGMLERGMNYETGQCGQPGMDEVALRFKQNAQAWEVIAVHDGDPPGYRAVVFKRHPDGQMVLNFNGTAMTSFADWQNNFAQGLGLNIFAPQYAKALEHAEKYWNMDAGIHVTGHSLGGGLASYAAAFLGANATLLNHAGLGATSMAVLNAQGQPIRPGQFTTYVVDGEILTGAATLLIQQPRYFGNATILPRPEGMGFLSAHQMESIGQIFDLAIPGTSYVPGESYIGYVEPNIAPTL
jgi:hypothetical protein